MAATSPTYTSYTEDNPAFGCIHAGDSRALFSNAKRWYADGLHVIQSTDFDVSAEDTDPDRVVGIFIGNLFDLADYLYDLQERGEATEGERQELALINHRLTMAFRKEHDHQEQQRWQRNLLSRLRKRGGHGHKWQRATAQGTSSLASAV